MRVFSLLKKLCSSLNTTLRKKKIILPPGVLTHILLPSSHMPDLFVKTSNKHESDSQPNMLESKAIIDFAILINGGPSPVIDYGVSL